MVPLLSISPERRALEQRAAEAAEAVARVEHLEMRRLCWQCVALGFSGVPLYGLAWYLGDPRQAEIAATAAFVISYGLPFFRWLYYHVSHSESFD